MVDPMMDMAAMKVAEGAGSVATEAVKSASESAATSAIKGIGEGGSGPPAGGTMEGIPGGVSNFTGGPMPEGFSPDPYGGTQKGVGGQSMPGKTDAPQMEKTLKEKLQDLTKKAGTVYNSYRATHQAGKDLMGSDAHKYDPVDKVHPIESRLNQWDKWH